MKRLQLFTFPRKKCLAVNSFYKALHFRCLIGFWIRLGQGRNVALSFTEVSFKEIETAIRLLKLNKASQYSDMPTKIIKENSDIFSNFICESINNSIKSSIFPSCLKHADVTPLHKKCNKSLKENYRPVSILPILSKVVERSIFKQISSFFYDIFSKYQYGFRKGFSTQQCLLALLEKWKRSIDRGKVFGALLTDLSKAFDCLNHDLLIAKYAICYCQWYRQLNSLTRGSLKVFIYLVWQ